MVCATLLELQPQGLSPTPGFPLAWTQHLLGVPVMATSCLCMLRGGLCPGRRRCAQEGCVLGSSSPHWPGPVANSRSSLCSEKGWKEQEACLGETSQVQEGVFEETGPGPRAQSRGRGRVSDSAGA